VAAGAAAIIAAPALAGCSASYAQGTGPFTLPCKPAECDGSYVKGPVVLNRIYDIEIVNLHNYGSKPVRLESVQLTRPAEGIRVISIRAYLRSQAGGGSAIDEGNLAKACPEFYKPHPLTDVTVPKHADSRWVVIIALVFERPGLYKFGTVKIGYDIAGQQGWQYFSLPDVRARTVPIKTHPHLYRPTRCHPGQGHP